MITESGTFRLVELDARGKPGKVIKIPKTGVEIRYALRLARRSPEGRYYVPYFGDGKIAVFDAAGTHDSGKRRGFQSTWRRRDPVFSLPLDHVLHGPGLETIDRWIGPALGSDHRAVVVTLRSR